MRVGTESCVKCFPTGYCSEVSQTWVWISTLLLAKCTVLATHRPVWTSVQKQLLCLLGIQIYSRGPLGVFSLIDVSYGYHLPLTQKTVVSWSKGLLCLSWVCCYQTTETGCYIFTLQYLPLSKGDPRGATLQISLSSIWTVRSTCPGPQQLT